MQILIIEDEPLVAKDLENLVKKILPEAVIVQKISSVSAALKWLKGNPEPDLILSDIQLSDGISFDIYEQHLIKCPIIFTTAYDEYAIRAFKLNSIDYLLKPIDRFDLDRALSKYKTLQNTQPATDQLKVLLEQLGQPQKKFKERFLCVFKHAMVPVQVEQIGFFHKDELIFLHTAKNEKLISEFQSMDEVEQLLNPSLFFRANRQYILHLQSVEKVKSTHKGITVSLVPPFNIDIDISREKAADFKKWLEG